MKKFVLLALTLLICGVSTAKAETLASTEEHPFLKYYPFDFRFGMGATLVPNSFLLTGGFEYKVDQFFSVGPMVQFGINNGQNLYIPTLGGRYTIPLFPTKRVELSVQTGFGVLWRESLGSVFEHFDYEFGVNVDTYIIPHLTAGIGLIENLTSSNVDTLISSLFASASYRF